VTNDISKVLAFRDFFEINGNQNLERLQDIFLFVSRCRVIKFSPVLSQCLHESALPDTRPRLHEYPLWDNTVLVCSENICVMVKL